MSVAPGTWARVSNAVQDPLTNVALAQDEVVKVEAQDGDWFAVTTLTGTSSRAPTVLLTPISNPLRTSSETLYCSVAPFEAQRDGDLSFGIHTLIVTDGVVEEGWLRGTVVTDNGKRLGDAGTLPNTYVVQLTGYSVPQNGSSTTTPREPPPISGRMPTSFTTDFSNDVRFRGGEVEPYARANYPFQGNDDSELSFNADEIITLTRRIDADWLEGRIGNRKGFFPQSFVQVVVPLPGESSSDSDNRRNSSLEDGIGYGIVRHDFQGRQKDELTVSMGDCVRVLQLVNNDWVQCRDPNTDTQGIVPIGFLEMYLDDDEDDTMQQKASRPTSSVDPAFGMGQSSTFGSSSFTSDWKSPPPSTFDDSHGATFTPSFTQNHDWATFGEEWLAPEKKATAPPARPPPPKTTVTTPSSGREELSLTEMFKPRPGSIDLASIRAVGSTSTNSDPEAASPEERKEKRNKVLEELIGTEIQYITDITAYVEAVESSTRLSTKQKTVLKNGCAQITQLAQILVQSLTGEQVKEWDQQAVGACFLALRKPFAQTYGYYFRNIEHINNLLNSTVSDSKMEEALKEVVTKMRAAGAGVFDTSTAVSRPVQRAVKYPLFLNEIAKYTPIHHPDHPKLLEAVKQMSTLGQKMNESKRRKELAKKYSEEQSSTSIGDMFSKLTVHSLKKKTNRFTYRMGSSMGIIKVTRDPEFERLVNELDGCERRLVRFNYMLVIYKKKMFFETRQLLQKRLIDIRKKQVSVANMAVEKQIEPFLGQLKLFAEMLNIKARDEIVKALRAIPKKLIKKRNDKLMDWEAARQKGNANANGKFLDFEALNSQVKQTVPRVVDVLVRVLREVMLAVRGLDDNLLTKFKDIYTSAAEDAATNPYQMQLLIVPSIPCFASFFDPNRLQPLQMILTKAEKKHRNRGSVSSNSHSTSSASAPTLTDVTISQQPGFETLEEESSTLGVAASKRSSVAATDGFKVFRAQTAEERKAILLKAEQKGRRVDMYQCKQDWPELQGAIEETMKNGKMLIVKQGDAVLAVKRDANSTTWLCYNGYYNALLPSGILTPWYGARNLQSAAAVSTSLTTQPSQSLDVRPHSTPLKQETNNLIDLDDLLGGPAINTTPVLAATPVPVLVPTPVGAAASANAFLDAFGPPAVSVPSQVTPRAAVNNGESGGIFDGVISIDWGSKQQTASMSNPFEISSSQRTPSMPNLPQMANDSTQPLFPVMFDESPTKGANTVISHLPPHGPAPSRPSVSQPAMSATAPPAPTQDMFTTLWEQIKDQPLSAVAKRSESPLPMIPTRPDPIPLQTVQNHFANFTSPYYSNVRATSSAASSMYPSLQPSYDTVPSSGMNYSTMSPMYSMPPQYDVVPTAQAGNVMQPTPAQLAPSQLYEVPPLDVSQLSRYDAPPSESIESPLEKEKPEIGRVRVCFDFAPVGVNQITVKEGEVLSLIQGHDDDGNHEWIWVRRANSGENGYIPAAYCATI